MRSGMSVGLALSLLLAVGPVESPRGAAAQEAKAIRVVADQAATGFAFPECVAYDPQAKALYVSQFGSELKPLEKDGKGKISKVSLDGVVPDLVKSELRMVRLTR